MSTQTLVEGAGSAPRGPQAFLDIRDLRIHFPTDDGLVKAVDGLTFTLEKGTHARHRGRVRLRQERHEPRHPRPAQGHPREDQRRDLARRRRAGRGEQGAGPGAARRPDGDDLPGPAVGPAPVLHGRLPDRRGLPRPQRRLEEGGEDPRHRDARPGRHPHAGQARRRLPAPVLRRHAAAGDDRDGAVLQPRAADRRRADDRARRDGAGADPRADDATCRRSSARRSSSSPTTSASSPRWPTRSW